MPPFDGFPGDHPRLIGIPETFFREVLPEINHLGEVLLTLHIFWRLELQEGAFHYLRWQTLLDDPELQKTFGQTPSQAQSALEEALKKALERRTLLQAEVRLGKAQERLVMLNSPRGRAMLEAIRKGQFRLDVAADQAVIEQNAARPNIFQAYEAAIGPLTPMIAEVLRDAEATYPSEWIREALQIAVERNKRSWRYVEAILRRWQEGGRDVQKSRKGQQDRRDAEEIRRRYAEWDQERRRPGS